MILNIRMYHLNIWSMRLKPERNLSHSPWFQVMFVLQNTPMEKDTQIANLVLEPIEQDTRTAKFELTFGFLETEQGLTGSLEYNCDLYDLATIQAMSSYLEKLMQSIVQDPTRRISEFALMDSQSVEQASHVDLDVQQGLDAQSTVIDQFAKMVELHPNKNAIEFAGQALTYQELDERSSQLAHYLRDQGVQDEDLVGLYFERSLEMLVGLWGVLKAGAAYVPIDPAYPQDRVQYILNDTQMKFVLANRSTIDSISANASQIIDLEGDWDQISKSLKSTPELLKSIQHNWHMLFIRRVQRVSLRVF